MATPQSRFIWHEILSNDVDSAARFYSEVVGWNCHDLTADGVTYTVFHAGRRPVAAVDSVSSGALSKRKLTGWIPYIGVNDVDASAAEVLRLGGALAEAPTSTTNIGRFAVAADPEGALFGLFAPDSDNGDLDQDDPMAPGKISWHELYTGDPTTAVRFYSNLLKWTKGPSFDMGPAGEYQVIAQYGRELSGVMRKPLGLPTAYWNSFFQVDDITSAEKRVITHGGTVFDGPREVPGGSFTLKCFDPEGFMFALSGTNR